MKLNHKFGLAVKSFGLIAGALLVSSPSHAGTEMLGERTASFETCVAYIQYLETKLSIAPDYTVNSQTSKIAQFKLTDGSGNALLVICSRPDKKMFVSLLTFDKD